MTQDSAEVSEELLHKAKSNLSMLLTEYSHPLIQYWKYEGCEAAIKEAFDLAGIQVDLQGKLGRRTKYQYNDLAQLVLDVKTQTVEIKEQRAKLGGDQSEDKKD